MHACEPGGLASAFLRTSGFSLATKLDQFSTTAAAGRIVQTGRHPLSYLVHPKPSGLAVVWLQAISPDSGLA